MNCSLGNGEETGKDHASEIGSDHDRCRRSRHVAEVLPGRLGFATEGIVGTEFEHGAAVFFDLQPGLKLALFDRGDLALDAGIARAPRSPSEFSLGHMVRNPEEVDAVMRQAAAAGAKIVRPAGKTFWGGYAGYFQDPDGHLWEILFNPAFVPAD